MQEVSKAQGGAAGQINHLAHVTMVHTDDVEWFGALGVAVGIQAMPLTPDPGLIPWLVNNARLKPIHVGLWSTRVSI